LESSGGSFVVGERCPPDPGVGVCNGVITSLVDVWTLPYNVIEHQGAANQWVPVDAIFHLIVRFAAATLATSE
jgi:hypothetical protein